MKKTKRLATIVAFGLAAFALTFAGCKDGDDGDLGTKKNKYATEPEATYDLSTTSSLSLKNYGYEVLCTVPNKNGETWTAALTFNDTDSIPDADSDDDIFLGEFAYIYPESGKGAGKIKLCMLDPTDTTTRTGTLTVTYASGTTITVSLSQAGLDATNGEIDASVSGRKKRTIGYGYNAYNGYASDNCIKSPLFLIAKMEEEGGLETEDGDTVSITFSNATSETKYREAYGSNIAEIEKTLNASANASTDFCGFSAELEASYDSSAKRNTDNQFAWTDVNVMNYTGDLEGTEMQLSSKEVLTSSAYKYLNGLTVSDSEKNTASDFAKIIKAYGTHYVKRGRLGGQLHFQMTADTSKIEGSYEVKGMVKAAYSGAFGSAEAKTETSYKQTITNNSSAFNFDSKVRGGSSATQKELTALLIDTDTNKEKINEWMGSLFEDINNCVFMEFSSDEDLVPIYELVDESIEGGSARKAAFKTYWNTTMQSELKDKYKQSNYVNGTPAKIEIPTDWDSDGSLIKNVMQDGVLKAVIANEYIPQLDSSKRVTVVYPATNEKIYYNMGYFVGNSNTVPYGVSWDDATPVLTERSEDVTDDDGKVNYGAVTALYIKNLNMTAQEPDYLSDGTEPFETEPSDRVLTTANITGGSSGEFVSEEITYNLVKILNGIYTRDYYTGKGTGNAPTYGGSEALGTENVTYYSKLDFCNEQFVQNMGNWAAPKTATVRALVSTLNNLQSSLPNGTVAAEFLKGGVLGLNLLEKTGWRAFASSAYLDSSMSYVGLIPEDSTKTQDYLEINYPNKVILVKSDSAPTNSAYAMHCPVILSQRIN